MPPAALALLWNRGSIPLRRMTNTTPGAATPFLRSGCLASGILLEVRELVRGNENQRRWILGGLQLQLYNFGNLGIKYGLPRTYGFLYESLYNSLKYFHSWLWADLEDSIPSRPVAVIMKCI